MKLGLCADCAEPLSPGTAKKRCPKCLNIAAAASQARRDKMRSEGLCDCGDSPIPGTRYCERCKDRAYTIHKTWREKRMAREGCMYCPEPRWGQAKTCKFHFVEKLLHNYKIGKEHVPKILTRFEYQKGTCFYTGIELVAGVNASLDHYYPKTERPDLISDPDNLVWCDLNVNFMKRNLNPSKLLDMMRAVVANKDRILAGAAALKPLVPA